MAAKITELQSANSARDEVSKHRRAHDNARGQRYSGIVDKQAKNLCETLFRLPSFLRREILSQVQCITPFVSVTTPCQAQSVDNRQRQLVTSTRHCRDTSPYRRHHERQRHSSPPRPRMTTCLPPELGTSQSNREGGMGQGEDPIVLSSARPSIENDGHAVTSQKSRHPHRRNGTVV